MKIKIIIIESNAQVLRCFALWLKLCGQIQSPVLVFHPADLWLDSGQLCGP